MTTHADEIFSRLVPADGRVLFSKLSQSLGVEDLELYLDDEAVEPADGIVQLRPDQEYLVCGTAGAELPQVVETEEPIPDDCCARHALVVRQGAVWDLTRNKLRK